MGKRPALRNVAESELQLTSEEVQLLATYRAMNDKDRQWIMALSKRCTLPDRQKASVFVITTYKKQDATAIPVSGGPA